MNQTTILPTFPLPLAAGILASGPARASLEHLAAADTVESRFGLRLASRLTEGSEALSPEIGERLRFARELALEHARATRHAEASPGVGATAGGALILGRTGVSSRAGGWRLKLASFVPVLALIGGLIMIERWQDNAQISVAAEIDAALLADDLPPNAYSDAGFAEFLKNPGQ